MVVVRSVMEVIMKRMTIGLSGLICVGMAAAALANPALLPKHPGYPADSDFSND